MLLAKQIPPTHVTIPSLSNFLCDYFSSFSVPLSKINKLYNKNKLSEAMILAVINEDLSTLFFIFYSNQK